MSAVNIRVAEPLLPFFETALQGLGGTEIDRLPEPDSDLVTITVDIPTAPADARSMNADLTFTADRPVHIQQATYLDAHGKKLATVTYP